MSVNKNNNKIWTPEEDEFLLESFGFTSMKYMKGRLKRSEDSIKQHYRELTGSLDMHLAGGFLSPRQIGPILGVEHSTVINWIHDHGLKSKQFHKSDSNNQEKRYRHFIDPQDLWSWIAQNKNRINFSQIVRGEILPEPDWLEEEIKKAEYKKPPKNWTTAEDEAAWFWWKGGVNYREIAKRLHRPEKGTQSRLTIIRKRKGVAHVKTSKTQAYV